MKGGLHGSEECNVVKIKTCLALLYTYRYIVVHSRLENSNKANIQLFNHFPLVSMYYNSVTMLGAGYII